MNDKIQENEVQQTILSLKKTQQKHKTRLHKNELLKYSGQKMVTTSNHNLNHIFDTEKKPTIMKQSNYI